MLDLAGCVWQSCYTPVCHFGCAWRVWHACAALSGARSDRTARLWHYGCAWHALRLCGITAVPGARRESNRYGKKRRPALPHQPNLYLEPKWLRCLALPFGDHPPFRDRAAQFCMHLMLRKEFNKEAEAGGPFESPYFSRHTLACTNGQRH